jgi:hypothetical protein
MPRIEIPEGHPVLQFENFALKVWQHLGLPSLTPIQNDIVRYMQHGPKRQQIHAFRGVGKSYICSAYVCWLLLLNPEEKILVISASKERADSFVRFTRRLIDEMPMLNHLIPDRNRGDRDSALAFDVGAAAAGAHSPSVRSAGVTGQITGSRASLIVLDDIEVPGNSFTPSMREKLVTNVREVDAILLPDDERLGVESKVRVLGTPQSQDTVYTKLEEGGYEKRVWPVEIPEDPASYRGCLAPVVEDMVAAGAPPGTPVDPERFDELDINERRLSFGSMGFALQFMLSTALTDEERYPLKTRDAIVASFPVDRAKEIYVHSNARSCEMDVESVGLHGDGWFRAQDEVGQYTPFEGTVVAVDPSAKGKDETAVVSASVLSGQVFVHRVFGRLEGYESSVLEAIAMEAKRVKAHKIVVEANYGGGMFSSLLRPVLQRIYPCMIEEVRHTTQKEQRIIDTLAPVLESHRLVFHEDVIEADRKARHGESIERALGRQLFYQMTHLTSDRGCLQNDDRLDCLAMAVAHFTDLLVLDAQAEQRARSEAAFDKMLDDWGDSSPTRGASWLSGYDPFSY